MGTVTVGGVIAAFLGVLAAAPKIMAWLDQIEQSISQLRERIQQSNLKKKLDDGAANAQENKDTSGLEDTLRNGG